MATGRSAAFFDLDRTLMSGSSGYFWARAAQGAGLMSRKQLAADAWANLRFRLSGSTDDSTKKIQARAGAFLDGLRVQDLRRLGPQVLAGVLPRLYPQMLERAWKHQDEGVAVYIATAASQDTAEMLAHVLGLDGGVGTPFEEVDGVYTGRLAGPMAYREGKAQAIRAVAERDGLDLSASYGYSDSESDLPMLRAVGHPVAVNPDGPLLRIAREEGWDVLRFDRLGSHLKMGAVLSVAALVGAGARRRVP